MSEQQTGLKKFDPDFTTTYADGLLLKSDDNFTCRLIFYEKNVVLEDDDGDIRKEYDKNLKFEVRLPFTAIQGIRTILTELDKSKIMSELSSEELENKEVLKAFAEYLRASTEVFYDTDNPNKEHPEVFKKSQYLLHKIIKFREDTNDSK